uniref:hypothetical protein n=2 Tax=Pseudomonas aeruginosa TaxID=287 RepID=UPI0032E8A036
PQNDVTLKMPAFEWVHVQLHQQKGMISLSPPTICNSATSLYNTDEGRNIVLNRILENDLRGIRLDYINFYVILDLSTTLEGMKLPIHLDFDDYIAKGNPYNCTPSDTTTGRILQWITGEKTYSYWSGHVLGGCARFYTELDDQNREPLSVDSARELLNRVGYKIPTKE